MRVGFLGDPFVMIRPSGRIARYPPLHLLEESHAWCAAAPTPDIPLYAGVVELTSVQLHILLDRARAAGLRMAIVLDLDQASATAPHSPAEREHLATWMATKGLPGPEVGEGQLDYIQRIQQLLNDWHTIDRTLGALETEIGVRARLGR